MSREPNGDLTPREVEILTLIASSNRTKGIAKLLEISPKTVETHRVRIYHKLGLYDAAGLTRYAISHEYIPSKLPGDPD